MPSEWTVARVMDDNPAPYEGPKGPLVTYWMAIEDGHEEKFCYWTRQPESAPPRPGMDLYGHLTDEGLTKKGKPKLKFHPDQREDGKSALIQRNAAAARDQRSASPAQARTADRGNASAPASPAVSGGDFDARGARIERMAAHKAAAHLVHDTPPPSRTVAFEGWLAYLSEDLDSYEAARRGQVSAPIPAPESPPPPEPSLEEAALSGGLALPDSDDIPFAPVVI